MTLADKKALLTAAMANLDLETLHLVVQELAGSGCDVSQIVELLQQGMQQVGDRFALGQYFLADLIVSGMMFKSALELITSEPPHVESEASRGRVLIGVVAGDIHDIGKDIIAQVLRAERFEILDLGVDVTSEAFVLAAQKYPADIIAFSGVLCESILEMTRSVKALTKAGIFPGTPIMVGGACVDELILENIGPVEYARGPVEALRFCKQVVEGKEKGEVVGKIVGGITEGKDAKDR
jgi:methanogenic corrinoid protein MtbC1